MYGYMGKILRVDLTNGRITEEFPDENTLKMFLGGAGLATKYLFDEIKPGIDPLGSENKLIFMTGPLTGTPSPSTGRYSIVAKSPLTGIWGQGNSAGFWGRDFKRSGFDGAIFEGISPKPVYLVTNDGKAELRDATHLWGKNTSETTRLIKEEIGEKFNVSCIGLGGELLVKYAAVMNDCDKPNYGRAAGRTGMGTVMGSKKLKAIASHGTKTIEVGEPESYKEEAKKRYDWVNESLLKMTIEEYGTAAIVDITNVKGGFPTRNWQTGVCKFIDKINGSTINETILTGRKPCFACPVACGRLVEIKEGPYKSKGEGPEYESIGALGAMCNIDDINAISFAHFLCNEYGLDTISAGNTIGFAMECYEKGILTKEDTGGLEINFGDADVVIDLVHKIGKREGIGDLLAEGTRIMANKLGKDSIKFAMQVKGLELPAYDVRAAKIMGLAYAVANRGGDHMTAFIQGPSLIDMPFILVDDSFVGDPLQEIPEKTYICKDFEDAFGIFDAIGGCKFMGAVLTQDDWATLISKLMGYEFTIEDFRKTGERIYNLERAFNVREGITRKDDTLPARLLEEPLPEGPAEGQVVNLDPLLDTYYEFRGWDKNGIPTPERLRELGLDWVIKEIH